MKRYNKPTTNVIKIKFQKHLLDSSMSMNVYSSETHNASESFSRSSKNLWDDEDDDY